MIGNEIFGDHDGNAAQPREEIVNNYYETPQGEDPNVGYNPNGRATIPTSGAYDQNAGYDPNAAYDPNGRQCRPQRRIRSESGGRMATTGAVTTAGATGAAATAAEAGRQRHDADKAGPAGESPRRPLAADQRYLS